MTLAQACKSETQTDATDFSSTVAAVRGSIDAYRTHTAEIEAYLQEFAQAVYSVMSEANAMDKNSRVPELEQSAKLPWGWRIDYVLYLDGPRYTLRHADDAMLEWDSLGGGHVILDRLDEDLAMGWWTVLLEYGSASKTKRKLMLRRVRPADLDLD